MHKPTIMLTDISIFIRISKELSFDLAMCSLFDSDIKIKIKIHNSFLGLTLLRASEFMRFPLGLRPQGCSIFTC